MPGAGVPGAREEEVTLSTEPIASPESPPSRPAGPLCPSCGSPLAPDQRYCLECGERQAQMSDFLRSRAPVSSSPGAAPPRPPSPPQAGGTANPRSGTVSLLAGVGVLLLALGVGVLIGRSGASGKQAAAPIVVTQGASTGGSGASEASFTGDWPPGTKGYTVQLQTLPVTGTTVASVEAAKTTASGKGANAVGALKSEEFSSLEGEDYVVYSGVYHKRAEAEKALGSLKKSFPGAKVIEVSNGAGAKEQSGGGGSSSSGGGSKPSVKSSLSKPAPPSALPSHHSSGKKFEEESARLPDVVSTG